MCVDFFYLFIFSLNTGEVAPKVLKPNPETNLGENSEEPPKLKPDTIQEDVKESDAEDKEGLPIYPYEQLTTSSTNPTTGIDVTKREVCMWKSIVIARSL